MPLVYAQLQGCGFFFVFVFFFTRGVEHDMRSWTFQHTYTMDTKMTWKEKHLELCARSFPELDLFKVSTDSLPYPAGLQSTRNPLIAPPAMLGFFLGCRVQSGRQGFKKPDSALTLFIYVNHQYFCKACSWRLVVSC